MGKQNLRVRAPRKKGVGLVLVAALFAVLIAACGSSSSSSGGSGGSTSASSAATTSAGGSGSATSTSGGGSASTAGTGKGITIGFVELFNEPYALQIAEGIKAAAAKYGASVKISGPASLDPSTAISDFQNLAAAGAKGILVDAYPADQWKHPISQAVAQGVDVDTIDDSSPGSGTSFQVGAPQQAMGAADARVMAAQLGKGANGTVIAGICVPGLPVLVTPTLGFTKEMKKLEPGITVKQLATGGSDAQDFAAWQRIIAQNSSALGFFGPCDQDLPALIKLKQSDPGSKWLSTLTAGGENPIGWSGIPKGLMTAAITKRGFVQGYVAATLMLKHLVNKTPEPKGWINTGFDVLDKTTTPAIAKALSSSSAAESYYGGLLKKFTTDPPIQSTDQNAQQTLFAAQNPSHNG
jgi:ABC-type sugar transport system substrate-binding protein